MRLSELLGAEVVDERGHTVGKVHDVRLDQAGPELEGFGPSLRVEGLIASRDRNRSASSRSSGTCSGVDPRQIRVGRLVAVAVAGIVWQALLAAGGYLVGHNLWHATALYGFFAAFRLAGSPRWPPAGGTDGCYLCRRPAGGARSSTVMVDRHQPTNRRGRSAECLGASPGTSCEEATACSFSG